VWLNPERLKRAPVGEDLKKPMTVTGSLKDNADKEQDHRIYSSTLTRHGVIFQL
jgi:hypothetical protein